MSLSTLAEQPLLGCLDVETVARLLMGMPVDARLRAREVSRGWRALLNDPRFWLVLDFSPGSGVVARLTRALLFAAGERGRGHLHTLDLAGVWGLDAEDLAQFVAAHGQSLRFVTTPEWHDLNADQVKYLCRSAPLCTLRCYVGCHAAEALPQLRCEAPCALLHIFKLRVSDFHNNQQAVLDFAAALPSHRGKNKDLTVYQASLRNGAVVDALLRGVAEARVSDVSFIGCDLAPASLPSLTRMLQAGCLETLSIDNYGHALFEAGPDLTAFCHALRSSTLQKLELESCQLTPASLPGLTRLIQAGCLERLDIYNRDMALFEEGPSLTAFCHALRSSTLQALELRLCQLWQDPAAAGELMAALVDHQTLRELSLRRNRPGFTDDAQRAAGEQLASLITHNSALQKLDLQHSSLGEAGLAPIFEALPRSSTLKELVHYLYPHEIISLVFARDVILPAVRANTSLRTLSFGIYGTLSELVEAQAIVAARTQLDAGAMVGP